MSWFFKYTTFVFLLKFHLKKRMKRKIKVQKLSSRQRPKYWIILNLIGWVWVIEWMYRSCKYITLFIESNLQLSYEACYHFKVLNTAPNPTYLDNVLFNNLTSISNPFIILVFASYILYKSTLQTYNNAKFAITLTYELRWADFSNMYIL